MVFNGILVVFFNFVFWWYVIYIYLEEVGKLKVKLFIDVIVFRECGERVLLFRKFRGWLRFDGYFFFFIVSGLAC